MLWKALVFVGLTVDLYTWLRQLHYRFTKYGNELVN